MNQTSQYIFNLYHYLLNLRDTLEFTINRDHGLNLYNQRKTVLVEGMKPGSAFGNFLENNKEQAEKLVEKLKEFIEDFYGDKSTVLMVSDEKVRVDHTQNIKIFEETIQLSESVRDILFGYMNFAKSRNELEQDIENLVVRDERLYRTIVNMLVISEYEKSFSEFQKVMGESQGKPTPQSNFIVQNELTKLANLIRFSREHTHITDNTTLDLLDKTVQVLQMCEGRRDRRDNRSFQDLFGEVNREASEAVRVNEAAWKESYDKTLKLVLEEQKKAQENTPKA